ncbi:MAG TPA: hypothetical protein VJH03_26880 [Blastocatellia bacterium]|nr:hypothetical protein [Blastocatellia bacterium]
MAHDVTFSVPERSLGNADLEFKVKKDGEAVGRLKVSKGSIVWVPKNMTYGFKLNWIQFDQLMQEHGTRE